MQVGKSEGEMRRCLLLLSLLLLLLLLLVLAVVAVVAAAVVVFVSFVAGLFFVVQLCLLRWIDGCVCTA